MIHHSGREQSHVHASSAPAIATKLAVLMMPPPWVSLILIFPHSEDGVFASPPNAFEADLYDQIPDLLFPVQRVFVSGVHDPGIVKLKSAREHGLSLVKTLIVMSAMRRGRSGVTLVGRCERERCTIISSRPNYLAARSTAPLISPSTPTSVLVAMALTFGYRVAIKAATDSAPFVLPFSPVDGFP